MGVALVEAVDSVLDDVADWPQMGHVDRSAETEHAPRRFPLERFPYHLVWVVTDDEVYVVAFAHDHQKPGYWLSAWAVSKPENQHCTHPQQHLRRRSPRWQRSPRNQTRRPLCFFHKRGGGLALDLTSVGEGPVSLSAGGATHLVRV